MRSRWLHIIVALVTLLAPAASAGVSAAASAATGTDSCCSSDGAPACCCCEVSLPGKNARVEHDTCPCGSPNDTPHHPNEIATPTNFGTSDKQGQRNDPGACAASELPPLTQEFQDCPGPVASPLHGDLPPPAPAHGAPASLLYCSFLL